MKKLWFFRPIALILLVLMAGLTAAAFFFADRTYFFVGAGVFLISGVLVILDARASQRDIRLALEHTAEVLVPESRDSLESFPLPVLYINDDGEILWYNDLLRRLMFDKGDMFGKNIIDVFNTAGWHEAARPAGMDVEVNGKRYTVYGMHRNDDGYLMYCVENTVLKRKSEEYDASRPAVLLLAVDNYNEILQSARESEKARLTIGTERILEQFIQQTSGFLRKLDRDKYLAVIEERHLVQLVEGKFPVLDQVRELVEPGETPITLSIGIGRGCTTLAEGERQATQALDMCLGRGGDQVAIKTQGGYEFYGGIGRGVEKKTKVKTRIVATALHDLIVAADDVVLMGHSYGDLDSAGASVGLARACRELGKHAVVATNLQKNLAAPLIERLIEHGYGDYFEDPDTVLSHIGKKTLLIVVDTHIQSFLESPEIYRRCKTVAVVDHHRKMVGHIDNATIFYHEPYASSASEMVAELTQYLTDQTLIGRYEAEALLAGIMLDTKNFVLRTGVRTFEAAAYLRRLGADTVEVRKLFASTMDSYQKRAQLMSQANVYKRCAIALSEDRAPDMRIVAPQAADEMLGITDVDASFVLYSTGDGISLSARSMGAMNVQVIAEKLGGGGHQTMAGAQFKGISLEESYERLTAEIDRYYANRPQA